LSAPLVVGVFAVRRFGGAESADDGVLSDAASVVVSVVGTTRSRSDQRHLWECEYITVPLAYFWNFLN